MIITTQNQYLPFLSENRKRLIIFIILSLYPLIGMGIDLISPSLPAISQALNTSSNFSKNLITLYLLGYMLGNFIVGFLSDALGRRKLMLLGLFVFTLVSLLPAVYGKPSVLLASRLLQGFALASFAVVSRAALSDILSTDQLIRVASLISIAWGIGPIIGPVIGGYLQFYYNWQACFYFFALLSFIGFLFMIIIVPETHFNKQPLQFIPLKNNFVTIINHRIFVGSVILMGILYSLLIVFNALGPFLIQSSLGYSPIYFGRIALFMGTIYLLGTFLSRQLLKILSLETIFSYTIIIFGTAAIISVIAAFIDQENIWTIIVPTLMMFLGCGIAYPVAMGKALSLFRHLAGSGSAVMNLFNISITSITAFVVSFLQVESALPLSLIYLGLMLLAGITYYYLIRPKNNFNPSLSQQ